MALDVVHVSDIEAEIVAGLVVILSSSSNVDFLHGAATFALFMANLHKLSWREILEKVDQMDAGSLLDFVDRRPVGGYTNIFYKNSEGRWVPISSVEST